MKTIFGKSEKFTMEYCCSIVRIGEVTPIEGSDFLATTLVNGEQIVVRKDQVKEGDIMVYASNETQLNDRFLSLNNLYEFGSRELNSNYAEVERVMAEDSEKAKRMVGFFPKTGRVRAIRLRGSLSMGYLFSISELINYNSDFKKVNLEDYVGEDFDTVDGEVFVKAYVPKHIQMPATTAKSNRRDKKLKKLDRMVEGEFSFHYNTSPLKKCIMAIQPTDTVDISLKVHGCVERNTLVNTMEFGDKTIGEIVDNKINCHIKAYDTISKEIVFVPIDNFYTIPNDGEWYEIELSNGKKVTITGNNPVWCENLQCYRRVDELDGSEILLFD